MLGFWSFLIGGMGITSHNNRSKVKVDTSKKTARRTARYEMQLEKEREKLAKKEEMKTQQVEKWEKINNYLAHDEIGKCTYKMVWGGISIAFGVVTSVILVGIPFIVLGACLIKKANKQKKMIEAQKVKEVIARTEAKRLEEEKAIQEEIKLNDIVEEFRNKIADGSITTKQQAIVFLKRNGLSQEAVAKTVEEYGF